MQEDIAMSQVIVITSGKGGVGKTTTSANVGTGLAILGKRVVLIDTGCAFATETQRLQA